MSIGMNEEGAVFDLFSDKGKTKEDSKEKFIYTLSSNLKNKERLFYTSNKKTLIKKFMKICRDGIETALLKVDYDEKFDDEEYSYINFGYDFVLEKKVKK